MCFQPPDLKHPLHSLPLCMTVLGCMEPTSTHVCPPPAHEGLQGLWKKRAQGSPGLCCSIPPGSTQRHISSKLLWPPGYQPKGPSQPTPPSPLLARCWETPYMHPAQPTGSVTAPCPEPQALLPPSGPPLVLCCPRGTACCSTMQPTHTDFIPARLVSPGCHKHT